MHLFLTDMHVTYMVSAACSTYAVLYLGHLCKAGEQLDNVFHGKLGTSC